MFESALIEHKLDKETYRREEPLLRSALLEAQLALVDKKPFSVVILVTGMDGAGKGQVIHQLLEWLDPRHVRVEAYSEPDDSERARPPMWRYWRDLPPKGRITIVFGSWYTEPLRRHVNGQTGKGRFGRDLADINRFEQMLASEDTVLLKFLLVVSAKEQKRRLDAFAKLRGGRQSAARGVGRLQAAQERAADHRGFRPPHQHRRRPWTVLPCDDPEYRDLTFGRTILETLRRRLAGPAGAGSHAGIGGDPQHRRAQRLGCARPVLEARRCGVQGAPGGRPSSGCSSWCSSKGFRDRALVVAFEGHDAAGKGGAIRRVTMALDPRLYRANPIAAPTDEEKARPYLWRFWRHVPQARARGDLRPLLVRPGPGRAGRGVRVARPSGGAPTARSTTSRRS